MRRDILNEQHPNAPDDKALINRCTTHIHLFIYTIVCTAFVCQWGFL